MTKVKINVNGMPTRVSVVVNNSLSLSLSCGRSPLLNYGNEGRR